MVPLKTLFQLNFFYFIIPSQFHMCLLEKFKLCLCINSMVLVKISTLRCSQNPYKFRGRVKRSREVKYLNTIQIITMLFDKLWFHFSQYLSHLLLRIYFSTWVNRIPQVCRKKTCENSQPFPSNSHVWPSLTLNQILSIFSMLEIRLMN